jgi:tetratricopeptide (TPR) repeat protein
MSQDSIGEIDALLNRGEAFVAYERLRTALEVDPGSRALRERLARALTRVGAEEDAIALLDQLREEGHISTEVLGLEASTRKSQALRDPDHATRREGLASALDAYEQARAAFPEAYWFGANVATLACVLGEPARAREVARAVIPQLASDLDSASWPDRGWALGTLGEARLVLGDEPGAVEAYESLRTLTAEHGAWEMRASARRNAHLLLHARPPLARVDIDSARIDAALRTPPVAIAAGHMVDGPERALRRFPVSLVERARDVIEDFLERNPISEGFASLACGTDILFQEALRTRGISCCTMLPFPVPDFVEESVTRPGPIDWSTSFHELWESANHKRVASRHRFAWEGLCYEFANELLLGLALLKADALGAGMIGLALWDGKEGDGRGGTESIVRLWRHEGLQLDVEVVDPAALSDPDAQARPFSQVLARPTAPPLEEGGARVMALVFADARGFSGLSEEGTDAFATTFLGLMAEVAARYDDHIFERNTWGDALFFALTDIEAAGCLALALCEATTDARSELSAAGLPEEVVLRVGLHAAPVRILSDPVRNQQRVSGAQISAAARIEPITPPGHVYASDAFAALSRARQATGYTCRYVGLTELAKGYGEEPVYVVERHFMPTT